jgi:hypothetical protein
MADAAAPAHQPTAASPPAAPAAVERQPTAPAAPQASPASDPARQPTVAGASAAAATATATAAVPGPDRQATSASTRASVHVNLTVPTAPVANGSAAAAAPKFTPIPEGKMEMAKVPVVEFQLTAVELSGPAGLCVAGDRLIIADSVAHTIKSARLGAGGGGIIVGKETVSGYSDGVKAHATLDEPAAVVADPSDGDRIYVADRYDASWRCRAGWSHRWC